MFQLLVRGFVVAGALALAACTTTPSPHLLKISVPDQKMLVFEHGVEIARYDVSTSKFGLGDRPGSYATPLGEMQVAQKIGAGQPSGMKFKSRRPTGEIVQPNAPGRDPIVSRILWLRGLEAQNRRAYSRGIYIHGTAEEWRIGTPASYGCIRMRSRDVINLFNHIEVGARVEVANSHFPDALLRGSGEDASAQKFTMSQNPPATPGTPGAATPAAGTTVPPSASPANPAVRPGAPSTAVPVAPPASPAPRRG